MDKRLGAEYCKYCSAELWTDGIALYCNNRECIVYNKYIMYIDKKLRY